MSTPVTGLPDLIPSPPSVVERAQEAARFHAGVWAERADEVPPTINETEPGAIQSMKDAFPHLDDASLVVILDHFSSVLASRASTLALDRGDVQGMMALSPLVSAYSHMAATLGASLLTPAE